ncbi:MAG: PQQ-dependent sugar dehydrogenase [Alphaproteobacteria bacterium]|nr:PQQ-dependent sugar dehydrogenase [Alphaproteobacteria bacterium]MBU0859762.1 PQQ-dependent sugar dehydrogenase [Alphaproteobacteria bacterium]
MSLMLVLSFAATPTIAQDASPVKTVTIAENLEHPWALAFLPGGDFLVTERGGKLWRVGLANQKTEIKGLPDNIVSRRQGGLLDVVLHPDFATNNFVYITYTGKGQGGTGTEVARGILHDNELKNLQVLFRAAPKMRSDVHFGSRLAFHDGYLFISLGDRMKMDGAQDRSTHWGSIIRLNDDGTIPADNPFAKTAGALPEIYSYGHRNIQGMASGADGILWAHEHGAQGGDELNIIKAGANYGWPVITHGIDYDGSIIAEKSAQPGMEQPVIHWTPSIAPSGMTLYEGDKFPDWRGDIFVGALAGTHLRRLDMDGQKVKIQEVLLSPMNERIRDVRTGPDGFLYVLTDANNGRLIRLEPAR